MTTSFLQKFMFEQLPIKGAIVVLEDSWQTIAAQRDYPNGLKQLLGELMAANVLMTSNLKLDGKVICQIQDNPHFNLVVSECSNNLEIRATAKFTVNDEALLNYNDYLDKGRLVVSIDSKADGNIYQSIIAFNGDMVGDILNNYMAQSEQLKSWFLIAYSEKRIVGFMLQQLPDPLQQAQEEIERVFMLANTLTLHELMNNNVAQILFKLFNEDNVRLLNEYPVTFKCSCSHKRVSQILRNLGKDELSHLIQTQGDIVVDCDYCGAEYRFSQKELEQFVLQLSIEEMSPISEQIN